MADEGRPPIRPDDASDVLRAAQQEQLRAGKLLAKTEAAVSRLETALSRYSVVRQGSGARSYAIHDAETGAVGTGRFASEESALKRIARLEREARVEAERRAAVKPNPQQYAKPIGPELPTQRATGDRLIRERRDLLRAEAAAAREAATQAAAAERKALGHVKSQRTRLNKLEEAPIWTRTGQDPADRERQLTNARSAVDRAERQAENVTAHRALAIDDATRATDAERAFRKEIEATNRAFGLREQLAKRSTTNLSAATFGSDADAERVLAARAQEARESAERAERARAAGVRSDSPEVLRRAEQERVRLAAAAEIAAQPRPLIVPRAQQGLGEARGTRSGRDVVAAIDAGEAQAERRLAGERQRREDAAAVRATVSAEKKAEADAEAAKAAKLQAAAERQAAAAAKAKAAADVQAARAAPGTGIVPRTVANAGLRSRAELEAIEGLYGLQRGPVHGEYPYAPIARGSLRSASIGTQPTVSGRPLARAGESAAEVASYAKRAAQLETLAVSQDRVAASQARMRASFQQFGTTLGTVSQAQRKHGALTTEFINAAVRGEASYKEWGYQIGATAAKFAGWTAVSIPVFAAIEGVRRIGRGAIDSSSGVQQLQRVIADVDGGAAQRAFRDLSGQFNVPIEQTTDAIFRMGQVFHTLPEATEAARAALYSFKVGGVDVETSTKNLLAVATGFGASGSELLSFFDQINQAQNAFGITIQNTEAGVAKAAGTFRNAGGDFSYLLALTATGQRATGRTGESIGTAIQRSVGFIQRPINQQQLREFGIDPTAPIEAVYDQAFERAKTLQGEQLQRLATALSSPQYASYFVPILQNERLFRQIQSGTSAQASRGSAERELNSVLDQLDQKIAKIGNNFERLGSNLGESGFLAPLLGSVTAMNVLVGATSTLLGLFNGLPAPLRDALAVLVLLRGGVNLARRTGVGEAFQRGPLAGAAPYLIEAPDRRARRAIDKGLNDSVKAARDEQQRAVTRAYTDSAAGRYAHQVHGAERKAIDTAVQRGLITEEAAIVARTDANNRVLGAEKRAAESALRATAALRHTAEQEILQADLVAAQSGRRGRDRDRAAKRFADEKGLYVNPSLRTDAPRSELARRAEEIRFDANTGAIIGGTTDAQRPSRTLRGDARGGLSRLAGGLRRDGREIAAMNREFGPLAAATNALGIGAQRVTGGANAAGRAARGAGGRLRGLLGGLRGLLSGWNLFFAALLLVPELFSQVNEQFAKFQADIDESGKRITSPAQRGALHKKYIEAAKPGKDFNDLFADLRQLFTDPGEALTNPISEQREQDAARDLNRQNRLAGLRRYNARHGLARPELTLSEVRTSIDADYERFRDGKITLARLRELVDLRLEEIAQSTATPEQKTASVARNRARFGRTGNRRDFYESLLNEGSVDAAPTTELDNTIAGLEAIVGSGEATDRQFKRLQASYAVVIAQTQGRTDTSSAERFATATQGFRQTVREAADAELERNLAFADTQRERDAAYEEYIRATSNRGVGRGVRRALRTQRANARFGLAQSKLNERFYEGQRGDAAADILSGQGTREDFATVYRTTGAIGRENVAQAGFRATIARTRKDAKRIIEALKLTDDEQRFMFLEIRRSRLEQRQALRTARTTVVSNTLPAGPQRIAYQIRQAGRTVAEQIKEFGRNSTEAMTAIAEQQQLQQELVDFGYSQIQSQTNLASAYATTPGGEAAANIGGLQRLLAYANRHPGRYDVNDRRDLRAQLVEAQKAEDERLREEAQDLIAAQFDLRRSRTDNPVQIAKLNFREARRTLRAGNFENEAERLRALANRNTTRREQENAIADRRLENAEYAHDIGKLSDAQYLNRLRAIQHTYEKGSEGYRRLKFQIGRFKHNLEDSTELELTPGNIKLPTLTEIRKFINGRANEQGPTPTVPIAIGGHRQTDSAAGTTKTINHNRIVLHISKGSEDKVFDALEAAGLRVKTKARSRRPG